MRTKLMWFFQEVEEQEQVAQVENKPNRQLQSNQSTRSQQPAPTVVKKKLFLTDGWDAQLKGVCIYIFRTNTSKQLPEEGFQKVCEISFIFDDYKRYILGFVLWNN